MPAGDCARCSSPAEFRSPLVIGRVVVGLLSVVIIASVALAVTDARSAYLLHRAATGHFDLAAARADDHLVHRLLPVSATLNLLCVATFIAWFHRCYRNTPARERRRSTAWAVWGWFIPIVFLWQPKRIANDLVRSSMGRFASPRVVSVWWALFIARLVDLRWVTGGSAGMQNRWALFAASRAIDVLAALAAIAVVRQVTASQLRAAAEPDGLSPVGAAPVDTGRSTTGRRRIGRLISAYWVVPVGLATAIGALLYLSSGHAQEASAGTFRIATASTSSTYDPARQRSAERLVRRFLETETLHPGPRASRLTAHAQPRLRRLGLWLGGLGAGTVAVKITSYTPGDTVLADITARFGEKPYSEPVTIGTLEFRVRQGRVAGARMIGHDYLASYATPLSIHGAHATVIYGDEALAGTARELLDVADAEAPRLQEEFGGGRAIRRPVIMLVPTLHAMAAACACAPRDYAVGMEYQGQVYVDLRKWEQEQAIIQRALVVHELTHVAMYPGADADTVPSSLEEGTATYEEQLYAGREGYYYGLERLEAAYQHGYPTLRRWSSTYNGWGLTGDSPVDLAYQDAFAVVTMVVQHHGGIPAVRRLVRQFRHAGATGPTGELTRAQLARAFRRATGVPFATVEAEAHSWVLSGAWKSPL